MCVCVCGFYMFGQYIGFLVYKELCNMSSSHERMHSSGVYIRFSIKSLLKKEQKY